MDAAILTAVSSTVVAVGGTIFTFVGRNRDSTDKRIDSAFKANQELVDDLRLERTDLRTRIEALEVAREEMGREMTQQREMLSEQAIELRQMRAREADMREWADIIMEWAQLALGLIRELNGHIADPPQPPHTRSI